MTTTLIVIITWIKKNDRNNHNNFDNARSHKIQKKTQHDNNCKYCCRLVTINNINYD